MIKHFDRRKFLKTVSAGAAGITTLPLLEKSNSIKALDLDETGSKFDNLKITDIKIYRMEFPGKTPRKWNSIITSGGGPPGMTILELYTNQGIVGRSMPKGPNSLITGRAFSRVKGKNPFFVEKIWDDMYRGNLKPVAKGDYIKSIGSIDIAIWDIIGKALGLPVYKVLGAHHTKIRVYAAGGYYREDKTTADLVKEMEGYVTEGFRAVKMKVGGASFKEDIERVKVVRDAIGPDIDLLIDANNKWLPYEAIRFGKAIEKFDPFWFEEPVVADDFVGCAEVRQNLDIPIVAGENEFTRWGCRDLITAGSADILNLDTVKAGGIT